MEGAVGVAFLNQDGAAVSVGVVRVTLPGVVLDQSFDEVLDDGIRGVGGREPGEVFGGFERDHVGVPPEKNSPGWRVGVVTGGARGVFI